jgi:hypothetical protein
MTEHQHNDNLERFFKDNLERYSPTPSGDFWARMEPAIPPKPSAWKGLATSFRKWAGLGLLLLAGTAVLVLWYRDKQEIERLSRQIAKQAAVASQNVDVSKTIAPATSEILPEEAPNNGIVNEVGNASAVASAPVTSANLNFAIGKSAAVQQPSSNGRAANPGVSSKSLQQVVETQSGEKSAFAGDTASQLPMTKQNIVETTISEVTQLMGATIVESGDESHFDPAFIPLTNISVSSLKNHAPSVKHQSIKPFRKPYPRISFESGAAAFAMPLSRLFSGDTLYAGRVRPSYATGLLLHYEINPSFAFQGGYQFKNIRTSRMELRYHSFPLIAVQNMKLGRSLSLEAEVGLVVNKLINMRSYTDGLALRGRKNVWLGWQSSLNIGIAMGDHVTVLIGPTVGSAISVVANSKRTWEAGLGLNLRYQF